jgi:hypothetical protein
MHPFTAGLSDLGLSRHSPFWADWIINASGRFYGRDILRTLALDQGQCGVYRYLIYSGGFYLPETRIAAGRGFDGSSLTASC